MDDAPRIGGAQMLFLLMGAPAAYHVGRSITLADSVGDVFARAWFAMIVTAVCAAVVGWLEVYARRRQREEAERRRRTPGPDPFVADWEARL